jgi:short-subunit dehydrogenase
MDAVARMIAQAQAHFGRIDALINIAGQGLHVPVAVVDLAQYRAVYELNVMSVLAAMQAVIPNMRAQGGGVIVNISSGTTKMLGVGLAPYSSTKHALNALTLAAREELTPENIRVSLVYPGITATDFPDNLANGSWQRLANRPLRMPMETPEAVAAKILAAVETEAVEVYADSLQGVMTAPS